MKISLNNDWLFSKDGKTFEKVRLPHANALIDYNYVNEKDYQFVSVYKRTLFADASWAGKTVIMRFEGVAHLSTLFINETEVASHYCGYSAFEVSIAEYLNVGQDNEIKLVVDSRESSNVPPFGNVIDYLTYGGIYREVSLEIKEKSYVKDAFLIGYAEKEPYNFEAEIEVENAEDEMEISCALYQNGKMIFEHRQNANEREFFAQVENALLWSLDEPNLCKAEIALLQNGREIDRKSVTFGFRTVKVTKNGVALNGEVIKLFGLNRHQSYSYVGYAMPKRQQEADARKLKYELGVNAVRTSHYMQSEHFLNECDRIGLLVFEEIPGWQHIGDEAWQAHTIENVKDMVLQHRNHPSIFLWGVRINESQDCDELYEKTNAVAHEKDKSRQTSGVRFISNSHLLEDVYAYNDFIEIKALPRTAKKKKITKTDKPFLVSEFNGHMFPTKSFDDEAHRTKQALKHASMVDSYLTDENKAGGFAWCAFDYNTHGEFGAGDKICYHGVCDVFRNNKLAGDFYASQRDGEPFLSVSSNMDKGDYAASLFQENYAFTNCDSVKLYVNGNFVNEFYPDKSTFPALKHAPILIDDYIGDTLANTEKLKRKSAVAAKKILKHISKNGHNNLPLGIQLLALGIMLREKMSFERLYKLLSKYVITWGSNGSVFRFAGVKDGKEVVSVVKESVSEVSLEIDCDCTELTDGDCYDVALCRLKAVDKHGNVLPYNFDAVNLIAKGSIEIIGASTVTLRGGTGGVYVKTVSKGKGELCLTHRNKTYSVQFDVK